MILKEPNIIQLKNPRSGKYVKIDRNKGRIIGVSVKKYKGIKLISLNKNDLNRTK